MNKRQTRQLPLILVIFFLVQYLAAQGAYSIRGKVINEKGIPVPGAQVRVDPLAGGPRSDIVRMVETDKDGQFSMLGLDPITYKVFAMKETEGYPNTAFAFYSNHVFPTVTLTNAVPAADMTLSVGPPAGVITGTVRDAVTGEPIDAGFLLQRASDANNFISMSQRSQYRVLVPPDVDVLVEVSAPGYKTWCDEGQCDTPTKSSAFRLESGKVMRLDIQLEPVQKSESNH